MDNKAFSLIELIIVLVIISLMASFGVPNFAKTVNRAKAKDAINNLSMIHASNRLYLTRAGSYLTNAADLAAVNAGLNLNIISNGVSYACNDITNKTCTASLTGVFVGTTSLNSPLGVTNPSCSPSVSGACP